MVASLFVDSLRFIPDHASLLLQKVAETAELAFTALGIAILLAVPIGLWLGHRHRGLFLALGVSSVGRALPSIANVSAICKRLGLRSHGLAMYLLEGADEKKGVACLGGKYVVDDDREIPDTMEAIWEYDGCLVTFSQINGNGAASNPRREACAPRE